MNYYQHHIGDYLTATAHLTLIEHGAYRRLLDVYYSTEKPLPLDRKALYRLAMARSKDEQAAIDSVVSEFFTETSDGIRQSRCDHEIELCNKNRDNGKKGGRPPKNSNPDVTQTEPRNNPDVTQTEPRNNPDVTQTESPHYPIPNTQVNPSTSDDVLVVSELPTIAPCPHQRIIALYAKHLPELPQPRIWEGAREKSLTARWRWVLTAKKPDGSRYASSPEAALDWFDRFFGYVAKSDFLTGRNGKWPGCDLGWLVKSDNFAKVISGNYDEREAACA